MITPCLERLDFLIDCLEKKTPCSQSFSLLDEVKNSLHVIEVNTNLQNSETKASLIRLQEKTHKIFKRECLICDSFYSHLGYEFSSSCENALLWGYPSSQSTKHMATSIIGMLKGASIIERLKGNLQEPANQITDLLTALIVTVQDYIKKNINFSSRWLINPHNIEQTYNDQTKTSTFSLRETHSTNFSELLTASLDPYNSTSPSLESLIQIVIKIYQKHTTKIYPKSRTPDLDIKINIEYNKSSRPIHINTDIKVTVSSQRILLIDQINARIYNPFISCETTEEILKIIGEDIKLETHDNLRAAIKLIQLNRDLWEFYQSNHKACVGNIEIFYSFEKKTVTLLFEDRLLIDLDTLIKTKIVESKIKKTLFSSLHSYIVESKKLYIDSAYKHSRESQQPRTLFFAKERVYLLLNKKKLSDRVLGKGTQKIVTLAIDLISGVFFASASFSKKGSQNELLYLNHFKSRRGFVQIIDQITHDSKIRVILELCDQGNLNTVLKKSISAKDRQNIFENLVNALCDMHEEGLLHRDLKPANILCKKNADNLIEAIIGDFDTICRHDNTEALQEHCTTSWWASPEYAKAILENTSLARVTTKAHDVWALGLTLSELLGSKWELDPSDQISFNIIAKLNQLPTSDPFLSPAHLICEMLQIDPTHRITALEAKNRLPFLSWD